jgi:hypothetical protein
MMAMGMVMIASGIRVRQLMPLADVMKQLLAVLLHLQGDVDIRWCKGSTRPSFRGERTLVELSIRVVIELVFVVKDT